MLELALQIILCLLLAALLGGIIGYFLGKNACPDREEKETNSSAAGKPAFLTGPRNGEKDNLTRIKGVGIKIEETLNSIGIYHFDQIADWDRENIDWVDNNVAFPGRVDREEWVSQAVALAAGEETEFSKRVDQGEVSSSKKS